MVLCSVECVERVSRYLGVKPGNLYVSEKNIIVSDSIVPNQSIEGFSTIIQALAENSGLSNNHLGNNPEKEALTRQWLEYAVLNVNYADNLPNSKRILKELNEALKVNTYFAGTELTIADVVLYYLLHGIVRDLNHQEKADYVYISRWFDNIQQDSNIRQKLELINFDLIHLYL